MSEFLVVEVRRNLALKLFVIKHIYLLLGFRESAIQFLKSGVVILHFIRMALLKRILKPSGETLILDVQAIQHGHNLFLKLLFARIAPLSAFSLITGAAIVVMAFLNLTANRTGTLVALDKAREKKTVFLCLAGQLLLDACLDPIEKFLRHKRFMVAVFVVGAVPYELATIEAILEKLVHLGTSNRLAGFGLPTLLKEVLPET